MSDQPWQYSRRHVLIFISPEYREVRFIRRIIKAAQPKLVIAMVHRGDCETIPKMTKMHKNVKLVTLSPHVSE